jgi:hypothetical protein
LADPIESVNATFVEDEEAEKLLIVELLSGNNTQQQRFARLQLGRRFEYPLLAHYVVQIPYVEPVVKEIPRTRRKKLDPFSAFLFSSLLTIHSSSFVSP